MRSGSSVAKIITVTHWNLTALFVKVCIAFSHVSDVHVLPKLPLFLTVHYMARAACTAAGTRYQTSSYYSCHQLMVVLCLTASQTKLS